VVGVAIWQAIVVIAMITESERERERERCKLLQTTIKILCNYTTFNSYR